METDTELSVIFNRANGIDKDPKYADIFNGLQQKRLFARMGHNSSSEQIRFSAGSQHYSDFHEGSNNTGKLIEDPEKREKMGRATLVRVVDKFEAQAIVEQMIRIYDTI